MTWDGWIWPMPRLATGGNPVISDGWKAIAIIGVQRQHLGSDLMYRRAEPGKADPPVYSKNFFCPVDASILCVGPGKVHSVNRNDSHGISVEIDHGNVPGEGPRVTVYRHLALASVDKGQTVVAGTVLGRAGKDPTQGAAGLNHLHFELWDTSRPVIGGRRESFAIDPAPALRAWRVKTPTGLGSPDISPPGDLDAGEGGGGGNVVTVAMLDLSVVPGGIL